MSNDAMNKKFGLTIKVMDTVEGYSEKASKLMSLVYDNPERGVEIASKLNSSITNLIQSIETNEDWVILSCMLIAMGTTHFEEILTDYENMCK